MIPLPLIFLATLTTPNAPAFGPFATTEPVAAPTTTTIAAPAGFAVGSLTAATFAPVADAEDWKFSYTFLEIGATRVDIDAVDDTGDTYYGLGSIDLFNLIYIFVGYENLSVDFQNSKTDLWTIGAGVHFSPLNRLDVLGDIAFVSSDPSSDLPLDSSDGYQARAGLRWMAMMFGQGGLELAGRAIWVDIGDTQFRDDGQFGFDVEARVHFLQRLSVGLGFKMLEDDETAGLNARFSF